MNVMKFGGSCLKDSEGFLKIVDIVKKETSPVTLVISAIYGVTNILEEGISLARDSEEKIADIVEIIGYKHYDIIDRLILNPQIRVETRTKLNKKLEKLEKLFYGIAYTKEITSSLQALILSFGERLAVATLVGVLYNFDIKATGKEADEIGIITDCSYDNATANLQLVKKNLLNNLKPVKEEIFVNVITGYFGCTEEGKITTFGRNGTDYSAAIVAYALGASSLTIWKDVDGFMSADPKFVPTAKRINHLSFYEAAELSYFGAKILHPRTFESLLNEDIEITIKNLEKPQEYGTIISSFSYRKEDVIKSVTYNRDIAVLRILGPGVGHKPGIIGNIGNILSSLGINIYSVITSQTCINLLIKTEDIKRSFNGLKDLIDGVIKDIIIENDIALIAVVGEGLIRTKGLAAKVFSAIAEQNINVEMISAGASEVAYYFIVKEINLKNAVHAIHESFFSKQFSLNYVSQRRE